MVDIFNPKYEIMQLKSLDITDLILLNGKVIYMHDICPTYGKDVSTSRQPL